MAVESRLVVMQPTYLPWAGYFNLLAQADDFVFLNDVQLEKQSWQTRNRWMSGGEAHWIIVPVNHTRLAQTIVETEVLDRKQWRNKLAKGFGMNYGGHPYFKAAKEVIDLLVAAPESRLADLNEVLIRYIAGRLGVTARLHRSCDLGIRGVRSERLVAMCQLFSAHEYLSPLGSANYLEEDRFAARSSAILRFQDYEPKPYVQKGSKNFLSHLSIVDVVANLGWEKTRVYVEMGSA